MPTYERKQKKRRTLADIKDLHVGYDEQHKIFFASHVEDGMRKPVSRMDSLDSFISDLRRHGYDMAPNIVAQLLYDKIEPGSIDAAVDLQGWQSLNEPSQQISCFTCRTLTDVESIESKSCLKCRSKYDRTELIHIEYFVEGWIACEQYSNPSTLQAIDTWQAIPSIQSIDIHFITDDDEEGENFGQIQAWAYRRDKNRPGDCDDELRVR